MVRTLLDRIDTVVSEPEDKMVEEKTVTDALTICGYPPWTFEKVKKQRKNKKDNIQKLPLKKNTSTDKPKGHIVLPYVKGLSERISQTLSKYNIGSSYKPHTTLRQK